MTSRLELAVSSPQTFPGRPVDPGFIRKYVARAEALGSHRAWVVEQIIGAHHPNALRRAVELGDGFIGAGSLSTAKFGEEVKLLRALLSNARRDFKAFPVAKRVYIAVDRDRARAGRRLTEWFGGFYGRPQMAEEVSVWGPPEECVAELQRVVVAGARVLMLNPVFDEMEHLEVFASEIASKV